MTKNKKPRKGKSPKTQHKKNLKEPELLLDKFTQSDLRSWKKVGAGLDSFHYDLYFGLEAQRASRHQELLQSLLKTTATELALQGYARIVDYQFSYEPLSSKGSTLKIGGRFNVGHRVDPVRFTPFPALYIASDEETARAEKFSLSIKNVASLKGLTREESSLNHGRSHSTVFLNGELGNLFELRTAKSLVFFVETIRQFKISKATHKKAEALGLEPPTEITTPRMLFDSLMMEEWRYLPSQHSIPSNSQTFAALVKNAGFEGIIYRSRKGAGDCIALFPDNLSKSNSYLELVDTPPDPNTIRQLNSKTWKHLK